MSCLALWRRCRWGTPSLVSTAIELGHFSFGFMRASWAPRCRAAPRVSPSRERRHAVLAVVVPLAQAEPGKGVQKQEVQAVRRGRSCSGGDNNVVWRDARGEDCDGPGRGARRAPREHGIPSRSRARMRPRFARKTRSYRGGRAKRLMLMKSRIPFNLPIAGRRKIGSRRMMTVFTTRNVRGIRRGAEYPRPFVQRMRCSGGGARDLLTFDSVI